MLFTMVHFNASGAVILGVTQAMRVTSRLFVTLYAFDFTQCDGCDAILRRVIACAWASAYVFTKSSHRHIRHKLYIYIYNILIFI